MSIIDSLGNKDFSQNGNVPLQQQRQTSGLGSMGGAGSNNSRAVGGPNRGVKKTGGLHGMIGGGSISDVIHNHDGRGPQQSNININHQSNLQQFAEQQILNSKMNKANLNESMARPTTNNLDTSYQIMRKQPSGNDGVAERVQTNISNLTSDFDMVSPLNNNAGLKHNNYGKRNNHQQNTENSNTIDGLQNNQALDVSTLSTHSINDITSHVNNNSRNISKTNLHPQQPQAISHDNASSTANKGRRNRNTDRASRMLVGPPDAANTTNIARPQQQELRVFQSPQNHSFLGGNGPNGPQYDETLAKSNMSILNSAGGQGNQGGLGGLNPAGAPPGGYNGIQSTVNRKEKRFFQKKDLQLQTTIRKGKGSQQPYVLSPDQIKFNQGNLQKRFEEDEPTDNRQIKQTSTFSTAPRRANSNNPPNPAPQVFNPSIQTQRKNSQSRTLRRNLDAELNGISFQQQNFLNDNFGNFANIQAPNATVAGGELSGIGLLSASLIQQEQGIPNEVHYQQTVAPNANSYLSNSSVAKTAVHKRRNISIGMGPNHNNNPDREGLESAQHLNGLSRPNVGNTYNGHNVPHGAIKTSQNHQYEVKNNEHREGRKGDRPHQSQLHSEAPQQNKYPGYINELLQNSQRQFSYQGVPNAGQSGIGNIQYINNMTGQTQNQNPGKTGAGSSFNTHGSSASNPSNLIQRLQNTNNIHDANPSYLLQKQMNSSRFGGFRTADGASSGSKNQYTHQHQMGATKTSGQNNNNGPISPQSNQSFRVNVENRRARPKIVKTSQDHGNMFFIQQANSMKNSSQIGQRKDIVSKMVPYNNKQSRGGDTTSQGGITSATTAIGNQDGISAENRSGHSGLENPHNISGGGNGHHQHSGSGNGVFGGDTSHKSISDRERTPTNKDQHSSRREDGAQGSSNLLLSESANNRLREGANGKQKDPYYFTFFNEKNEASKEAQQQAETGEDQLQQPSRTKFGGMPENNGLDTSVCTDYSNENFPSQNFTVVSKPNPTQIQKKTIPTKPQLKSKSQSKQTSKQTSNAAKLASTELRESQNVSKITQEDDLSQNNQEDGYLKIQKQIMSTQTPQKDMNQIKSKFDSNTNNEGHSYQTLDQDTRRVNRPIRGNHHTGMQSTTANSNSIPPNENGQKQIGMLSSKLMNISANEPSTDPTPQFNSQKQTHANTQNQPHQAPGMVVTNARKRQQQQQQQISSQNAAQQDYAYDQQQPRNDRNQPSYTPVRRDPQNTYQRSKPQSPKILLPQCFLEQPTSQNVGLTTMSKNQISKVHPGKNHPIDTSNIGKITPITRDGNLGSIPQTTDGTTPPSLQNRNKNENYPHLVSRENYVRRQNYQSENVSRVMMADEEYEKTNAVIQKIQKNNRGSSVTPNLPNLSSNMRNLESRGGFNGMMVSGPDFAGASGDINSSGSAQQYRPLASKSIQSRQIAMMSQNSNGENNMQLGQRQLLDPAQMQGMQVKQQHHAHNKNKPEQDQHLQNYLNSMNVPLIPQKQERGKKGE